MDVKKMLLIGASAVLGGSISALGVFYFRAVHDKRYNEAHDEARITLVPPAESHPAPNPVFQPWAQPDK